MSPLLPWAPNKLCSNCKSLVQRFQYMGSANEPESPDGKSTVEVHHCDGQSFFAAGDSGCRICEVLMKHHLRNGGTRDENFYTQVRRRKTPISFIIITMMHKKKFWAPESSYCQLRFRVFQESDAKYKHLLETCRTSPLSESLDDPVVFDLARRWLSDCTAASLGHEKCIQPAKVGFRPQRLLDIHGDHVFLSLKTHNMAPPAYCALSYCWGDESEPLILTTANEKKFRNRMDFCAFPKTIQDAIRVTRTLRIGYIWVDRLCIIQSGDGGRDWTKHSTEMSKIYSNCTLNLSADRAQSATEGFLGPRDWPPIRPIFIDSQMDGDGTSTMQKFVLTIEKVPDIALATEPLGTRGWILSERISSPRTLHFGAGEIFWECNGCPIASESCPRGFAISPRSHTYTVYDLAHPDDDLEAIDNWVNILTSYSRLSLSQPSTDKLVALAGAARLYEESTGKSLVGGIIRSTLPMSLLWQRQASAEVTRSSVYRAPSWSWASLDGPLFFYESRNLDGLHSRDVAEVLDVWVKPVAGGDHLGQLEGGAITIRGPVISLKDSDYPFDHAPPRGPRIDLYWDEPQNEELNESAFALSLSVSAYVPEQSIKAILLAPTEKTGICVRVGVMSMRFKPDEDPEALKATICSRFLEKCEMRTVVIV